MAMANCVSALTRSVAKFYGTILAGVFFRMTYGKTRTISFSAGVQRRAKSFHSWKALMPALQSKMD